MCRTYSQKPRCSSLPSKRMAKCVSSGQLESLIGRSHRMDVSELPRPGGHPRSCKTERGVTDRTKKVADALVGVKREARFVPLSLLTKNSRRASEVATARPGLSSSLIAQCRGQVSMREPDVFETLLHRWSDQSS